MSMNKAQAGKKVAKKPVAKKKTPHPNDDYKDMVDPATGKKGTMGGEGTRPPFTRKERSKMPRVGSMGSGKNGKTIKKAKSGTSLGMKSVKAGFDKNPGVTRADIITAATKKAKSGTKVKKAMMGTMAKPMMKSGGSMKKCKYGCK
jgi:hypothetical protein